MISGYCGVRAGETSSDSSSFVDSDDSWMPTDAEDGKDGEFIYFSRYFICDTLLLTCVSFEMLCVCRL
jgi:hypothetical protein